MTNFFEEEHNTSDLIKRYEAYLRGEKLHFFEVSDYVEIIEFYLGNYQKIKAENAIATALEQYGEESPILYKKVELFVLQGYLQKALQLLEELSEANDDAEFHLLRGTVFTSMQKFQEANLAFQNAIEREEDNEHRQDLIFRIGLAFQHVSEFRFALQHHYKLYEEQPKDLENLFEMAYCYEQLGHFESSIRFYNKYLDISPYTHKVWYNLGIIYNRLQRYEEAVEAYDYTLAIRPTHSKAFFNKGNALFALKRYKEALSCYFSYLDYEDNHSFTHTYIGECYEKLGQYESAVLHYSRALEIDRNLSDAWFGLGMVAKLQGNIDKAIYFMEKAAKADQTYAECYAELGELYALINEDTLAINAYRYAIIAEPEIWQYHLDLAKFYHQRGNITEAYKILDAIQKDFTEEAELFYYLSLFAFLLDKKEEAKRYLQQAKYLDNEQFITIINYCKRNNVLIEEGQIDELLKLF